MSAILKFATLCPPHIYFATPQIASAIEERRGQSESCRLRKLPNLRVSVYCDSGDTVYSVYTTFCSDDPLTNNRKNKYDRECTSLRYSLEFVFCGRNLRLSLAFPGEWMGGGGRGRGWRLTAYSLSWGESRKFSVWVLSSVGRAARTYMFPCRPLPAS